MASLDAGAEDFMALDDAFEVYTAPAEFSQVREALEQCGYTFISAELDRIPQNTIQVTDPETVLLVEKFLDWLDDNEDVQGVFHNGILPGEE